jgi:transposase-like protein
MEREWLASRLEAGRSIESIARETGRAPSTVAYWVNWYGLVSCHASKHLPRGGISRDELAALVDQGMSVRSIAAARQVSPTTVRYWLRKHGLRTRRSMGPLGRGPTPREFIRECARHGWTAWVRTGPAGTAASSAEWRRSNARRRRVKEVLVTEAGGACRLCGYSRYAGALQFHHVDPAEKSFALSSRGVARSLAKARAEVSKCVLLCANCHAEVEAGLATIPIRIGADCT